MAQVGIQETKELLEFGFKLQQGIVNSLEDGKMTGMDLPSFFPAIMSSTKGIGGIQKVGAELMDLTEEEKQELLTFVREKFDLPDDQLEELIEDTLHELLDIYRLAIRWSSKLKKNNT